MVPSPSSYFLGIAVVFPLDSSLFFGRPFVLIDFVRLSGPCPLRFLTVSSFLGYSFRVTAGRADGDHFGAGGSPLLSLSPRTDGRAGLPFFVFFKTLRSSVSFAFLLRSIGPVPFTWRATREPARFSPETIRNCESSRIGFRPSHPSPNSTPEPVCLGDRLETGLTLLQRIFFSSTPSEWNKSVF